MITKKNSISFGIFAGIFLLIFLPTLLCIAIWGNGMDYNLATKLICSYGNKRILVYSVILLLFIGVFLHLTRNITFTKRTSLFTNIGLGILFTILFVANIKICECINISQGWDVSCVMGTAYELNKGIPIGDDSYYSVYANNVPIAFILYKLFHFADGLDNFKYVNDFMWVIVICLMVSVAGYITCITVKKLTDSFSLTVVTALIYFVVMLLTPWKTVAYTDMFSILFPVLSLNMYVWYRLAEKKWLKYLLWFLCFLAGFIGSLIKPTVMVVLITIVICESIKILGNFKSNWKEILIQIGLAGMTVLLYFGCQSHIYKTTGYTPNEEVSLTALHYLMMGLNEDSTGSFSSDDLAFSCSFATREERTPAQIERIGERLEEKGFFGYLGFAVKKMVMTFNDGTFGWGREGAYNYSYPIYSDNEKFAESVRNYFYPLGERNSSFNTHSQTVWFLIVFSLPGICFVAKAEKEKYMPILLSLLGVILYLILFEARARYLICFLPVIIMAAVIGMWQYCRMVLRVLAKIKFKKS